MARPIQVSNVSSVLIAGEWYEVADWTFAREPFAFQWTGMLTMDPGADGFTFKHRDGVTERWISGPLTALQAVRYQRGSDTP